MQKNVILKGSADSILQKFPEKSIDLVVTSPPYNVGMKYDECNDNENLAYYRAQMRNVSLEIYRVLKTGGRFVLNLPAMLRKSKGSLSSNLFFDWYKILVDTLNFLPGDCIHWLKTEGSGRVREGSTSWGSWCSCSNPVIRDTGLEYIMVFHKESFKLDGEKLKGRVEKKEFVDYTKNVWVVNAEMGESRKVHPAPFPLEIPRRIISLYSYRGNLVLDPFCGTGTTCMAAKILGRDFIGIDLSEKYCKYARNRLSQEVIG